MHNTSTRAYIKQTVRLVWFGVSHGLLVHMGVLVLSERDDLEVVDVIHSIEGDKTCTVQFLCQHQNIHVVVWEQQRLYLFGAPFHLSVGITKRP